MKKLIGSVSAAIFILVCMSCEEEKCTSEKTPDSSTNTLEGSRTNENILPPMLFQDEKNAEKVKKLEEMMERIKKIKEIVPKE